MKPLKYQEAVVLKVVGGSCTPTTYYTLYVQLGCSLLICLMTTFPFTLLLSYFLPRLALCLYLGRNASPIP
jgi:hypothetical protein